MSEIVNAILAGFLGAAVTAIAAGIMFVRGKFRELLRDDARQKQRIVDLEAQLARARFEIEARVANSSQNLIPWAPPAQSGDDARQKQRIVDLEAQLMRARALFEIEALGATATAATPGTWGKLATPAWSTQPSSTGPPWFDPGASARSLSP